MVAGDSMVGKTQLLNRLTLGKFSEDHVKSQSIAKFDYSLKYKDK